MSLKSLFNNNGKASKDLPDDVNVPGEAPSELSPAEALQFRLCSVLADEFPYYTVRTNVPAAYFDPRAHEKAKPISILVSRGAADVLAIAIVAANTYRSMPVVGTKRLVEAQGIQYVRFFPDLANEPSYIAERLRQYLPY